MNPMLSAALSSLLVMSTNPSEAYAQVEGARMVIESAIADPARPGNDRSRDVVRKPAETLQFCEVKPGDIVADFNANAGYFTRLFADVVGNRGHVYAIEPTEIQDHIASATAELRSYAAGEPVVSVTVVPGLDSLHGLRPLDLFWISQNYHDLHNKYFGPMDMAAFNKAVFDALKPGGLYVILDHSAATGAPADVTETLHRIDPTTVRREIEAAGFQFVAQSSILANPADPRTIAVFDKSVRGRTDQFLLKFRKPKPSSVAAIAPGLNSRDGQHDFDFQFGTWKTHVKRLRQPLAGASSWADYDGVSVVSKVWDGRASLLELSVDGPSGHIEGYGLRLYNPQSHQWSLNWVSGAVGNFDQPMIGQFDAGRGEFMDQELFDGRSILARNTFTDISMDSARFEQAFSNDGARSWETNWIMTFTRVAPSMRYIQTQAVGGVQANDGQRDFDFAFGSWKTHIKHLRDPLSGSTDWLEYDGVHTIRKVSGGRGNLGELTADGSAGHIEALSARIYEPQSHLWRISYANPRDGILSRPVTGGFKNGRGEFYGQETVKGRQVLVRETYSSMDSNKRRLEMAYSADGGRSWETYWVMVDSAG